MQEIDGLINKAIKEHNDGNLQEAKTLYEIILKQYPNHSRINHNLGLIYDTFNKHNFALPFFKKALESDLKKEQFWISYIKILYKKNFFILSSFILNEAIILGFKSKDIQDLEKKLKIELNPKIKKIQSITNEESSTLLDYFNTGNINNAQKLAELILTILPNHLLSLRILGIINFTKNNLKKALDFFNTITKYYPSDHEAYFNLGTIHKSFGNYDQSINFFNKAISLKNNYFEAFINLGNSLKILGKYDEAIEINKKAISIKPQNYEGYINLGTIYQELNSHDYAISNYKKSLLYKKDNHESFFNLGISYRSIGKLSEAIKNFEKAISLKEDFSDAHRQLALLKSYKKKDWQFYKMLDLNSNKDISNINKCHINFALAKASEDIGDLKNAFNFYKVGNSLRKQNLKYNISFDIELFNNLKKTYSLIKKFINYDELQSNTLIPIFIVGMPRSGTTLIEQIISNHSKVNGAGELPFAKIYGHQIVNGKTDISIRNLLKFKKNYEFNIKSHSKGLKIITDKMPTNFQYLGLLTTVFPNCKVVHVKRDAVATCWGNFKTYFVPRNLGYCYDLNDIEQYFNMYLDLMTFWKNEIKTDQLFDLDYELLTLNQNNEIKNLINFLDLNWEDSCLNPHLNKREVSTASNIQVRNKIYTGSSNEWKKFKPYLNGYFENIKN